MNLWWTKKALLGLADRSPIIHWATDDSRVVELPFARISRYTMGMKIQTKHKIKTVVGKVAIVPITAFSLANMVGMHQLSATQYLSEPIPMETAPTLIAAPGATFIKSATGKIILESVKVRLVDTSELSWATSGSVWGHIMFPNA